MRTSGAPGHVLYLGRYTVLEFRDPLPVLVAAADNQGLAEARAGEQTSRLALRRISRSVHHPSSLTLRFLFEQPAGQ